MVDTDFGILILFLLLAGAIVAHAAYVGLRKPNRRVPALPVNRKNLRRIAYLRGLTVWFIYIPLVIAVTAACRFTGRIRTGAALGTAALLLIVPLIYIYQLLRLQHLPLRRALADKTFDAELAGKEMLFLKGAWQYADANWFIRVGVGCSAALCARQINFAVPARLSWLHYVGGGGPRSGAPRTFDSPLLCFTGFDGSEIAARLETTPDVVKWVKRHGGRIRY